MASSLAASSRWRRMKKRESPGCEALLRRLEPYCTAACARFLRRKSDQDRVWYTGCPGDGVSALLIRSRQSLFPVFNGQTAIPAPRFLNRFPGKRPLHAIQGLRQDTELLEKALEPGYAAGDRIDYDLMILDPEPDSEPQREGLRALLHRGPPGLGLRKPGISDLEKLFPLQAAYEQEEVLPRGAEFSPLSSRLSLEHVIRREHILAAELDGRLVAKINTNALSFTRYQLGGVYVLPGYRGLGIATAMTAALVLELAEEGRGTALFVKKRNAPARAVYRRLGFRTIGDYRICYY
ncbi:MAG: GNAT family N-acetyltransferase [Spirochaetaceae bacterium]|jgi:ribosomal protein S18 acetylase RimI-like enzyme|nr:GNAT family N-acetyltransferase [Spirochaetaceae bacterium]